MEEREGFSDEEALSLVLFRETPDVVVDVSVLPRDEEEELINISNSSDSMEDLPKKQEIPILVSRCSNRTSSSVLESDEGVEMVDLSAHEEESLPSQRKVRLKSIIKTTPAGKRKKRRRSGKVGSSAKSIRWIDEAKDGANLHTERPVPYWDRHPGRTREMGWSLQRPLTFLDKVAIACACFFALALIVGLVSFIVSRPPHQSRDTHPHPQSG